LGGKQGNEVEQRILGVKWNFVQDQLLFDLSELVIVIRSIEATKRQIASKFYDPLGFVSPITIQFKMLFRDLCVCVRLDGMSHCLESFSPSGILLLHILTVLHCPFPDVIHGVLVKLLTSTVLLDSVMLHHELTLQ